MQTSTTHAGHTASGKTPSPCGNYNEAFSNCLFCADALLALAKIMDADKTTCDLTLDDCEKDGLGYLLRLIANSAIDNLNEIDAHRGEAT